jgi:fatty-acyl-CoA synthase
VMDDGAPT